MSKGTCVFEGCDRPVKVKKDGLCSGHYNQKWSGRPLSPIQKHMRLRPPTDDTKICTSCMRVKTHDEFYLRTNNGLQSKCKECMKAAQLARSAARRQAKAEEQALEASQGA